MARVAEALAKLAAGAQGPPAIKLPGGSLQVERLPQSRLRLTAAPNDVAIAVSRPAVESGLSWPLVDAVAASTTVAEVCEVLARYEDPASFDSGAVHRRMEAYVDPDSLSGHRIADYGCGRGWSVNWLGAMYPGAEIVGIDPDARLVELARRVAKERNRPNVFFHQSLAEAGRGFQAAVMSTVDESQVAELWTALAPGGILLVPNPAENRSLVLRQIERASAGARAVELRPRQVDGEAVPAAGLFARLKRRLFGGNPRAALPEMALRKDV